MKKYILILKTEMSDKKMLIFTSFIIFMIISCILGFFGTIYGRQHQLFHNKNYVISGYFDSESTAIFDVLNKYDSELKYYIISNITDKKYQDYKLVSISNNYDIKEGLQGVYNNKDDNSIVIPYGYSVQEKINIGDQIEISNRKYKITGTIGLSFDNNSFIVTDKVLLANSKLISLEAIVNKDISQSDYEKILSEISPYMNEDYYFSEFDKDTNEYLKQFRIYAIVLFIAAIINVIYIYSYTMTKRKQRTITYRLVGATNRWIYTSIIIDNLVVFTFCYILAVVATITLYNSFLVPNIPNTAFMLSMKDIITFYLAMISIFLLIIVIYLRKIARSTITELNHKEGF